MSEEIQPGIQLVIPNVDPVLVEQIDEIAQAEDRSRAAQIRKLLEEIVALKRAVTSAS